VIQLSKILFYCRANTITNIIFCRSRQSRKGPLRVYRKNCCGPCKPNYSAFVLPLLLASQLSRGVLADAGLLCDKAATLGATIKERLYIKHKREIIFDNICEVHCNAVGLRAF